MALIRFFLGPMLLYKRRMIYAVLLVTLGLWLIPRLPFPKPASVEQTAVTEAARESGGRPPAEPAGPPPATGRVGDEHLVSGGIRMAVLEVRRETSAGGARQAGPGNVFVILRLGLMGTTALEVVFKREFLTLRDQQGRVYPVEPRIADQQAGWLGPAYGLKGGGDIARGLERVSFPSIGLVHFEVPADAAGLELRYEQWDVRWGWMRFRILLDG